MPTPLGGGVTPGSRRGPPRGPQRGLVRRPWYVGPKTKLPILPTSWGSFNGTTGLTRAVAQAVAIGDCVLVHVAFNPTTMAVSGVADDGATGGNVYVKHPTDYTAGGVRIELWYCFSATKTATTVTVTATGSPTDWGANTSVYRNVVALGNVVNATGTGTPSVTVTMQDTNNYLVGFFAAPDNRVYTVGSVGTYRHDDADVTMAFGLADRTTAGTGALFLDMTHSTATNWAAYGLELRTAAPSGGTTFTQSVSGSVNFSGNLSIQTQRTLGGSMTGAGALLKQTQRTLLGSIAFSGALNRLTSRILASAVAFSGTVSSSRVTFASVSGSITLSGTLQKQTLRILTGAVAFSGTLSRLIARTLTGAVAFAGALLWQVARLLSGSITPSGTLNRLTARILVGSITPSGALTTARNFALSGVLALAGALSTLYTAGGGGPVTTTRKRIAAWLRARGLK